jgi:Arc/MetJ-type ribon-helix-helix transcriptional regulator
MLTEAWMKTGKKKYNNLAYYVREALRLLEKRLLSSESRRVKQGPLNFPTEAAER